VRKSKATDCQIALRLANSVNYVNRIYCKLGTNVATFPLGRGAIKAVNTSARVAGQLNKENRNLDQVVADLELD
jgi:hypothetical protein